MRRYFPIFLDILGKDCVVIGGGKIAFRKVASLLKHGAKVKVVSPEICSELKKLVRLNMIGHLKKKYDSKDLEGAVIVFAATSDKTTNEEIYSDAMNRNTLINVVDNPRISNFISPSCLFRGDLCIAVSTSGKSPALARKIRTDLDRKFDECYALLVEMIDEVRSDLKFSNISPDGEAWQEALNLDLLVDLMKDGRQAEAKTILKKCLGELAEIKK